MKYSSSATTVAVLAIGLVLLNAAPALASTITISALAQQWVLSDGSSGAGSYVVGNLDGEYRNFFVFRIPQTVGTIVSAQLSLPSRNVDLEQSSSATYQVTSLSNALDFADIGTGEIYGSRVYTNADWYQTWTIDLNAAAVADTQASAGGLFGIGGRLLDTTFGLADDGVGVQLLFSGTNMTGERPQLILTISDGAGQTTTPEPASFLLFAPALAVLVLKRRRGHTVR
jgi:hypothetical protein